MHRKEPCVYILTNKHHTVLYTGVTSDLSRRMSEHLSGNGGVFTRRYNTKKLVFAEFFPTMMQAILAEKQIKAGSRAKKTALIEASNPEWRDLMDDSGKEETPAKGRRGRRMLREEGLPSKRLPRFARNDGGEAGS